MRRSVRVMLSLKCNKNVAREVAEAVLMRCNPHDSQLVANRLVEAGVTVENLIKYYEELTKVVAEFWNAQWDYSFQMQVKPYEMRNLYLPLLYGVIFASVGNIKVGSYEYLIQADPLKRKNGGESEGKIDRDWLLKFSADLESVREYVTGDIGQVGNTSAQPQSAVMMSLLGQVSDDGRVAEMYIRDGQEVDKDLAGLSTLVGLSLVEEANSILYTGIEEVSFRQLLRTIVQREPKA